MTWILNENCRQVLRRLHAVPERQRRRHRRRRRRRHQRAVVHDGAGVDGPAPAPAVAVGLRPRRHAAASSCATSAGSSASAPASRRCTAWTTTHGDDAPQGRREEDLASYCMVGCVEPNIHGKMSQWSDGGHYNFGAAVQFALDDGRNWADGRQLGVPTGPSAGLRRLRGVQGRRQGAAAPLHPRTSPSPTSSRRRGTPSSCPSRSRRRWSRAASRAARDIVDGGALYNAGPAFIGTGVADLADSLAAVKKLVYDEQRADHGRARRPARDGLRRRRRRPPDADQPRAEVRQRRRGGRRAGARVHRLRRRRGRRRTTACSAARSSTASTRCRRTCRTARWWARCPPAGAPGRPLADGCSPFHGYDTTGPTAAIKSVAAIDHERHTAGTLLNVKLNPRAASRTTAVSTTWPPSSARSSTWAATTSSSTSSTGDTLRAAQDDPEQYRA